jgi:hypothetical protein
VLQGGTGAYAHKRTLPVVSAEDIGVFLVRLQGQDVWASRSRIHIMATSSPPYASCVYLGKGGLLGGGPPEEGKWLPGPSITLARNETRTEVCHIQPGYRYKGYRLKAGSVIQRASCTIRYVEANSREEIDKLEGMNDGRALEEKLTADFGTVVPLGTLEGSAKSSSVKGHQVLPMSRFTHAALVLYGSTKRDKLFRKESKINVQLEICVEKIQDLKPAPLPSPQPPELPGPAPQLEAQQETKKAELAKTLIPATAIGTEAWEKYFGDVGSAPDLPSDMVTILDGPCPFWPEKLVKDTHLLVLMPATVGGVPFTLNRLGELIQRPSHGGHRTEYRYCDSDVERELGNQPSRGSYWLLMTRDALPGSRRQGYADQKALVAGYASRESMPYALPSVLEAATAILMHHAREGERLFGDDPRTYTRCQEVVDGYPTVVGGFASSGLGVSSSSRYDDDSSFGVACCRKF